MLKGSFIFFYLYIILEKVYHHQVKAKRKNRVNIMKQFRFSFLLSYLVEVNNTLFKWYNCHVTYLSSEIWVNVKDNVRTMNPIPVTYFGNYACLTEGVPWNSSNFRQTFHSILVYDMTNRLVSVFRFSNFTVLYYRW